MIGIGLLYDSDGVSLDLVDLREGMSVDMQNAVVNVMTKQGSDAGFPNRGTSLSRRAVSGSIVNINGARHASNFAALATMQFIRQQRPLPLFADLRMNPLRFEDLRLVIELFAVDTNGDPVVFTTKF